MWYLFFILFTSFFSSFAMEPQEQDGNFYPEQYMIDPAQMPMSMPLYNPQYAYPFVQTQMPFYDAQPVFMEQGYFSDPITGKLKPYGEWVMPMYPQFPVMQPMLLPQFYDNQFAYPESDDNGQFIQEDDQTLLQSSQRSRAATPEIVSPIPRKSSPSPAQQLEQEARRQVEPSPQETSSVGSLVRVPSPVAQKMVQELIKKSIVDEQVAQSAVQAPFSLEKFEKKLDQLIKVHGFSTYNELISFKKSVEQEMDLSTENKQRLGAYVEYAALQLVDTPGNENKRVRKVESALRQNKFSLDAAQRVRKYLDIRKQIIAQQQDLSSDQSSQQQFIELDSTAIVAHDFVEQPEQLMAAASSSSQKKAKQKRKKNVVPSVDERFALAKKALSGNPKKGAMMLNDLLNDQIPTEQFLQIGQLLAQQFDPLFAGALANAKKAQEYYARCREKASGKDEQAFRIKELFCAYADGSIENIEAAAKHISYEQVLEDDSLNFATGIYALMRGRISQAVPHVLRWATLQDAMLRKLYGIFQQRLDDALGNKLIPLHQQVVGFSGRGKQPDQDEKLKAVTYFNVLSFYHRLKKMGLGNQSLWQGFYPEEYIFDLANNRFHVPPLRYVLSEFDLPAYLQIKYLDNITHLDSKTFKSRWIERAKELEQKGKFSAFALRAKWAWQNGELEQFINDNKDAFAALSIDFCDIVFPLQLQDFTKEISRLAEVHQDDLTYQLLADYQRVAVCMCMRFDKKFSGTNVQNILEVLSRTEKNPLANNLRQACFGLLAWNNIVYCSDAARAQTYLNRMDKGTIAYKFIQATILSNQLLKQTDHQKQKQLDQLIDELTQTEYKLYIQGMMANFYHRKNEGKKAAEIIRIMESDISYLGDVHMISCIDRLKEESNKKSEDRVKVVSEDYAEQHVIRQMAMEAQTYIELVQTAFKEKQYHIAAQFLKQVASKNVTYAAMLFQETDLYEKFEKLVKLLKLIIDQKKVDTADMVLVQTFYKGIIAHEQGYWDALGHEKEDIQRLRTSIVQFRQWSARLDAIGKSRNEELYKDLLIEVLQHPEFLRLFKKKPVVESDITLSNTQLFNLVFATLYTKLSGYKKTLHKILLEPMNVRAV